MTNAFEKLGRTGSASAPDGDDGRQRTFDVAVSLEEMPPGASNAFARAQDAERRRRRSDGGDSRADFENPPGCEHGRRFVFENEGNERPGMRPARWCTWRRRRSTSRSSDAATTSVRRARSLIDGLCGTTVALTGIDGKQLSVPVETIVDAGSTKVVSGEGMARRAEKAAGAAACSSCSTWCSPRRSRRRSAR